ncbi:MAG: CoA transferase [Betaproteobacteria bacterium]|nr:CoA transferase [Betaproteobacteria bacterium]
MLQGYTVLDLTARLGWLAGRLLADLGADVTRIEAPDADRGGAEWRALNVNKRVLLLDAAETDGLERVERLARSADILFCTPRPGDRPARFLELNPRLVVVAITPFGLTGPKAGWLASDLEIMAAGGAMSLAGEPDGMPVRVSAPQAYAWAGAQAAVGALVALHHRGASGKGQMVDVSAQSAVITALAHAPTFVDISGITPTRAGAYVTGRSVTGAKFRVFWRCRDGHLNFILYGGGAGRHTNEQLVGWMRSRGFELGPLERIDWSRWDPTIVTQEEVDVIERPLERFFATLAKREFLEQAHRRGMLGYPVSTVADIASDPHLAARGFWQDVPGPDGPGERHCGAFVVVDGHRAALHSSETRAASAAKRIR